MIHKTGKESANIHHHHNKQFFLHIYFRTHRQAYKRKKSDDQIFVLFGLQTITKSRTFQWINNKKKTCDRATITRKEKRRKNWCGNFFFYRDTVCCYTLRARVCVSLYISVVCFYVWFFFMCVLVIIFAEFGHFHFVLFCSVLFCFVSANHSVLAAQVV